MSERTVLLDGLAFPEAPRWHAGELWISDFYRHEVVAVDLRGRRRRVVKVPKQPSGLGFLPDRRLLVVSMLDRSVLALADDGLRMHADLSAFATGPCNDMVVDQHGRAYVGNFGYDRRSGEPPRTAKLVRVDPDGTVAVVADDLAFPNGMVITPDGATLILAESYASRLVAWDRRPNGDLTNKRIWAELGHNVPDGICLDADGGVWVADPRNNEAIRVVEGGAVTDRISTGDRGAYACMLGGANGRMLFLCTNTTSGPATVDIREGRIEMVEVEVPCTGWP